MAPTFVLLLFFILLLSVFSEVLVHSSGMCPSRYMGNTVMVLLSWKLALPPGRFNVLLPTGRTRPYSIGWND